MSKVRFKLNRDGVRQLMKSEEAQAMLVQIGNNVRNRCGDGYDMNVHVGKNRANVMVWAATYQSRRDNYRNNTILKALK